MLWEIDIHPAEGQPDRAGDRIAVAARELNLAADVRVATAHGFLVQGEGLTREQIERLANDLLADVVVERALIGRVGDAELSLSQGSRVDGRGPQVAKTHSVTVLLKPGVMDPVAETAVAAAGEIGVTLQAASTIRKYWFAGVSEAEVQAIGTKLLANDAIEKLVFGPLQLDRLELGRPYHFELRTVPIRELGDDVLVRLSREGQLYLQPPEMQTIRQYFRELGRDPTDVELETIAQTWSEHCSHKTLAGRIAYRDEKGERQFDNMLRETIFAATQTIRKQLGSDDWCVSVFEDNAGIVRFDEEFNLAFKVETHNHPSALEPYGGANTGLGGVIRDILGTGLGAKPVANTDVFCFAPVTSQESRVKSREPESLDPRHDDPANEELKCRIREAVLSKQSALPTNKYQNCTDVELMLQVAEDDGTAFSCLVSRYQQPVLEKLTRSGFELGQAEDLAQQVFLRAYRARKRYLPKGEFAEWLFSIAASVASIRNRQLGDVARLQFEFPQEAGDGTRSVPATLGAALPPGVLHPRRVMRGVVEGVRDYGNRMGIPTVNGAVYFDERYLGNPLVFCGTVGLIPRDKSHKQARPGDLIVAIGGRTGRDGIHGATFSSAELTSQSEHVSGGAVQIGNAVEEKKVLDMLLAARDRGLYTAVTDCGAGGFSSAVGEMGEKIGAAVQLEKAPLKYEGLSYTEIWISEAQERMVLAVPEDRWPSLNELCASEDVEATVLGRFVPTGRLRLSYQDNQVADLDMKFLHKGRPLVVRRAEYKPSESRPLSVPQKSDYTADLLAILGSPNVASKEWIIRQYDHEVQGGSVVKPLVGAANDGPSDAAVVRPVAGSRRGMVISCGMNPRYGDFDTYHMAASAIDEAIRNAVAVGADPRRIAILDNFCWGDCERPETLGALVRAALACHDVSIVLGTPFISGKDSLNNEFSFKDENGQKRSIAIPPTLLISALGQVDDVATCVTMDLKEPGNLLFVVGETKSEMGGSHFALVNGLAGGQVPTVDPARAKATFAAVHQAISEGLVRACHDLSEGGLAAALAEMAFAGWLGARIQLESAPISADVDNSLQPAVRMFGESNTRFVCEVTPADRSEFERELAGVPYGCVGEVAAEPRLVVEWLESRVIDVAIGELKEAWQAPLRW